jgi:hypothetical protein
MTINNVGDALNVIIGFLTQFRRVSEVLVQHQCAVVSELE